MKKRRILRQFLLIACCVFLCLSGCGDLESGRNLASERATNTATGRYIRGSNGTNLILIEEGYSGTAVATMGNATGDETVFDSFETGDRIRIRCDGYREIYPLQTTVYECQWLEKGSLEDIPQEYREYLTRRGWMNEPVTATFDWTFDGQEVQIQATYRALWFHSEVKPTYSGATQRLGLHLYIEFTPEVEMTILYYPDGFTVESTDATAKHVVWDNGLSGTMYTESFDDGSVAVTVVYDDCDAKFVTQYQLTQEQRERYEETILTILETVSFSLK